MKELLAGWMMNLTLFSLLSSLVEKLLPGKCYLPYIRIFCGVMMILTLLEPVLKLSGLEEEIEIQLMEELYEAEQFQMENELIALEEGKKEQMKQYYVEYLKKQQTGNQEDKKVWADQKEE